MRSVVPAVVVLLVSGMCGCNQQPSGGSSAPPGGSTQMESRGQPQSAGGEFDADLVLRQSAAYYLQQQSAQCDYEQALAMDMGGMKQTMESQSSFIVERPNRIAIRPKRAGLTPTGEIVSDGEQLTISVPALSRYSQSPAPPSLDDLLANPILMNLAGGGRGPLLELFTTTPYETLMAGVTSIKSAGREKIGEIEAYHLQLEQKEVDWELWIAAQGDPRVIQARFDMTKALAGAAAAMPQLKDAKMVVTQQYRNWKFDGQLAANAFAFEPPEGSTRVADLLGGVGAGEEERSPLLGQPAPNIEQDLLEGGRFNLAELQGKKVVILDFWATWCGPCVREMPLIAKVADEYRDRDVALVCVNQAEATETIQEFLKDKEFKVTVSLDAEGQAAKAYGVEGIPMLVLVNKAGVVQSVHIGFSPNIGTTLREELDAILAGKDLATEAEDTTESPERDSQARGP